MRKNYIIKLTLLSLFFNGISYAFYIPINMKIMPEISNDNFIQLKDTTNPNILDLGKKNQIIPKNKHNQIKKDSYKIQGKIIDENTGEIIPYCSISQINSSIGTSSNELGEFELKTNILSTQLTFTHLGYEEKTVFVSDGKMDLTIKLNPLVNVLEEIVLKTANKNKGKYAVNLAKKAYNKIQLYNQKNRSKFAKAFYRQKSKNGNKYSEFAEIIYDLRYNVSGIEKWDILQGRYALEEKSINNKNYTLFSRILKSFQPQTKDMIFPLHPTLEDYYDVSIDDMIIQNKNKIAILKFTPKIGLGIPIFHGEAYINTSTYEVLKINGIIRKDDLKLIQLSEKNTTKKNYQLSYDIVFKKDSIQNLIIDYIKIDQEFDYYKEEKLITHMSATSNLTFFEHYKPTSFKKLGRQFRRKDSDWDKLNQIGYNKEFWENNPIVKRVPIEKKVINDFEKRDAFGSIFLDSKEQVVLIQSNLQQDSIIRKLDTLLGYYNYYNPVEKVYLHTDKNKVDIGGELWYSAYTVIGPAHYFSSASKFIYVDIVDIENNILSSQRVKIINGKSKGYIKIPDNTIPGKYQLRAYTDWMRNYDLNFIFKKTITISNEPVNQINVSSNEVDLQFFPEGGNAVYGLMGRIAFKAIGTNGLARVIKGKIIDLKGNEVRQLKSNNKGVGSFNLKPTSGEQYTAVLENGMKYPLPKIYNQGYSMFVNNINQRNIQIRIQASNNFRSKDFYLIGMVGNQKYFQGKYHFKGKSFVNIEIPKNMFPSGVTTFTLFDENMKPWSERIAFIDNQQKLIINTKLNKDDLIKKGEVNVKINVTDPGGKPISTNLSIAVTNQNNRVIKDLNDSNILTYLLLESDVKGYIEKPAQFFRDKSRETKYNLDLIMLTNGWRKFNWQKLNNHNFDTIKQFSFSEGFRISGKAKQKKRKALENKNLHLIVKSKDKERLYVTKTKKDGSFTFNNIDHTGATEIQFKAYNDGQINVEITLDNINLIGYSPVLPSLYKIIQTDNSTTTQPANNTFKTNYKGKTTLLNEVIVKGKAEEKPNRKKSSPSLYNIDPDATVFIDENRYINNYLFALYRVPGIRIIGQGASTIVSIRGGGSPLWVLDGTPIGNDGSGLAVPMIIANLNASEVERIEVIKRAEALFGMRGANGVIMIYTKRGFFNPTVVSTKFKISGFSESKQFYTPKYDVDINQNDNITLYWNPLVKTDKNGNASIKFYNMTNSEKIQIAIEALSNYGVPGTYLKTFRGKK